MDAHQLSARVRPDVEAAPWVLAEIKALEAALLRPVRRLKTHDGRLWLLELADGRVVSQYNTWSSRAAAERYLGPLHDGLPL